MTKKPDSMDTDAAFLQELQQLIAENDSKDARSEDADATVIYHPKQTHAPLPAYNSDYSRAQPHSDVAHMPFRPQKPVQSAPSFVQEAPKKKKHRLLKSLLLLLLLLVLLLAAFWFFYPQRPDRTQEKAGDVATVLIAGTDADGLRTDTMLLLSVNRDSGQLGLLSLPRDLLTYVDGKPMKLNAVYAYGGCGETGMELLMQEMPDRIGFRPDGYILLDFDGLKTLVDRMGGIEFDVPCDMFYDDPAQDLHIALEQGRQTLDGEKALWVLRYRSGYALADLQRVQVQRELLSEALRQWTSPAKLPRGLFTLLTVGSNIQSDLSGRHLAWLAKAAWQIGLSNIQSHTLPGSWSSPYYYPDPQSGADLLNTYYNPTTRTLTQADVGY